MGEIINIKKLKEETNALGEFFALRKLENGEVLLVLESLKDIISFGKVFKQKLE